LYTGVDAAVSVIRVPDAATLVNPLNVALVVMLPLASRNTRELAPEDVVTPVPPLATAKVPATVTTPPVAVLGVNPVDPKLIVVTPPPSEGSVSRTTDIITP
jgi:hypothetical protein